MPTLEITCDDLAIISSGSFINTPNGLSSLKLCHNDEFIQINIEFIDNNKSEVSVDFRPTNPTAGNEYSEGTISFINFNNRIGISGKTIMPLGEIANHQLLFNYKIEDLGDNLKLVFYTFYIREIEKNE